MRLAIVSDLHAHPTGERDPAESWLALEAANSPTNHPVTALEALITSEALRAEVVVCPGDLSNRGSANGLTAALGFVDKIAAAFGDATRIVTPGNHDLATTGQGQQDLLSNLRPHLARFPGSANAVTAFWRDHFAFVDHGPGSFLVLNTTGKATDRATARRGIFDEPLRDALRASLSARPLGRIRVAILHHHPLQHSIPGVSDLDILERGDELLKLLADFGFVFVVHGHKHHPRLSYCPAGSDGPAVLAAGSLASIPRGTLITGARNLFHLVDIDVGNIEGLAYAGVIRTWQFVHGDGWVPASRNSSRFPHSSGFGCRIATSTLATTIAQRVGGVTRWADLVSLIDGLEYLTPDDQTRVLEKLTNLHNVDVAFDSRGDPHILTPMRQSR